MMRETGRLLSLLVMLAGTIALALLANQTWGLLAGIIAGVLGLLITAATLRL